MARALSAGQAIATPNNSSNPLALSFWCKSNTATANMVFCSKADAVVGSTNGFTFYTNSGGNMVKFFSKGAGGDVVTFTTAGTFRDGNWHHFGLNYPQTSGQTVSLYMDNVLEGSATPGSNHGGANRPFLFGRTADTFWGSFAGDFAEIGIWSSLLTAEEFTALSKGFRPPNVKRNGLLHYIPCVREGIELLGSAITYDGTTSDHPRML